MFNIAIYKYPSGYQVRVYKNGIIEKSKGEFYPGEPSKPEREFNPFAEKMEIIKDLPDVERAKQVSLSRTRQNIYYIARSNVWEWFVTFTFNPELIDSFDYSLCTARLSDWLSNMRKKCPNMRYIVVPEKHESGRYHFHGLFADCDGLNFIDSGHKEKGQAIYNISAYKYGFTTATRVRDTEKVSKYICKYVTKDLCSVASGKRRYWASRNINKAPIVKRLIKVNKRNGLMEYLHRNSKHVKRREGLYNETFYFELLVSDNIDISPFLRESEDYECYDD